MIFTLAKCVSLLAFVTELSRWTMRLLRLAGVMHTQTNERDCVEPKYPQIFSLILSTTLPISFRSSRFAYGHPQNHDVASSICFLWNPNFNFNPFVLEDISLVKAFSPYHNKGFQERTLILILRVFFTFFS